MQIMISGIGMKIGDQLRTRIEDKLGKFSRYFGEEAVTNVKLRAEKEVKTIEVTMQIHSHYYRAESSSPDVLTALEQAVDVLEGQIRKHKTRIEKRIHDYAYMKEYFKSQPETTEDETAEAKEASITKRKSFDLKPMDSDEAVLQMEMLGHSFLLYMDVETEKVCLVYKRKDGNYGLIEPQY
jgi:putative sigma-54 modulation protein